MRLNQTIITNEATRQCLESKKLSHFQLGALRLFLHNMITPGYSPILDQALSEVMSRFGHCDTFGFWVYLRYRTNIEPAHFQAVTA
jgi:hypothetical protein